MTTNPKIIIHNSTTNEVIEREMTEIEIAKYETAKNAYDTKQAEAEAGKAAILAKLGITADEAKLLLA
jgi:hypothetical protein